MLADSAEKHGVPIHMHLVETLYQKQYARSRGDGGTAVDFIGRFGLQGPKTALGHAVWL
jgi:cytosine/adenosine deaminase-related metal-dependent hydrolase